MDSISAGGSGYTITPMVITNPDGSESIAYDDAVVESNDWRQNAIEYANNNQEDWVHTDSEENSYHEAFSPNSFQDQEFDKPGELWSDEDVNSLVDQMGGAAEYERIVQWAAQSMDEGWIQEFDAIMDAGDPDMINHALSVLYGLYNDGEQHDETFDEYEDEQLSLEVDEVLEMAASLQDENPIASQAFTYLAACLNGEISFEEAVGYVSEEWGQEAAEAIFQQIIEQNT